MQNSLWVMISWSWLEIYWNNLIYSDKDVLCCVYWVSYFFVEISLFIRCTAGQVMVQNFAMDLHHGVAPRSHQNIWACSRLPKRGDKPQPTRPETVTKPVIFHMRRFITNTSLTAPNKHGWDYYCARSWSFNTHTRARGCISLFFFLLLAAVMFF